MPTNRHAQIRYTVLDQCFSNFNRVYTYDDLLREVNNKLRDIGTKGIEKRQLQYDIQHMQSSEGWSIELEEGLKQKRKKVFRYADKNFTIADNPLNVSEIEQLETTLTILSRYKHREEFSWLEELIPRMQQAFDLVAAGEEGIISYQQNVDLKGIEHLGTLFNLIVKHKQIKLIYEPFNKSEQEHILNPLHLKQYNNRWFLFGYNTEYDSISNFPLDRINLIEELGETFAPHNINWLDYFDDIIGVTHPEDAKVETIKLRFSEKRISYVKTKPLHSTQRILKDDPSGLSISIEVIPNNEMYQLLLSFGHQVEVLAPEIVRKEMKAKIQKMVKIY
jgi:predicted DNA-binding transcriptional regulator YafY